MRPSPRRNSHRMKARKPTTRSSTTATHIGEAPKGFSRCFHAKVRASSSPPVHPSVIRASSRTPGTSSPVAGRIEMSALLSGAVASGLVGSAVKAAAAALDRVRRPPPGLVVLIYHRVGRRAPIEVDLPLALFEEQISFLAATNRTVGLSDGLERVAAAAAVPEPLVAVTFDDGTADFAEVALPVLERHRVPVTLYVATEFVDSGRAFPDDGTPLSWRALADAH